MNKKTGVLLVVLFSILLVLGSTMNQKKALVVESEIWIGWDCGCIEPEGTTTYEDLSEGLVVYEAGDALKITVKSVSGDKVTLAFGGYEGVVEENPDGTINLGKDPLREIDIKSGQTVKLVTQTMDAGTYFTISYGK